jgi:hypothetical protein
LPDRSIPTAAQHTALQEYRDTIDETESRLDCLSEQLRQLAPTPTMPVALKMDPTYLRAWAAYHGVDDLLERAMNQAGM